MTLLFLEPQDTHYRNQFETKTSGGLLKPATREKWERDLFGGCYVAWVDSRACSASGLVAKTGSNST